MRRQSLTAHHGSLANVGVFGSMGRQHAQHHGPHQPGHLLVLLGHHAGDVPLGHVAEFMRQHRGQLVRCGHRGDQPQVDTKVTARQRKRIHGAVSDRHQLPGKTLVQVSGHIAPGLRSSEQGLPDGRQVINQHRVIQKIGVAVNLLRNAVSQLSLGGQVKRPGFPQARQPRRHTCARRSTGLGGRRCSSHRHTGRSQTIHSKQ